MNIDKVVEFVSGRTDMVGVWRVLDAIEKHYDIQLIAVSRAELESAIGYDGWEMSPAEWKRFSKTDFWKNGIMNSFDHAVVYEWARDTWLDELGYNDPHDEAADDDTKVCADCRGTKSVWAEEAPSFRLCYECSDKRNDEDADAYDRYKTID